MNIYFCEPRRSCNDFDKCITVCRHLVWLINPARVSRIPNKLNINCSGKDIETLDESFALLVEEIKVKRIRMYRVIVL